MLHYRGTVHCVSHKEHRPVRVPISALHHPSLQPLCLSLPHFFLQSFFLHKKEINGLQEEEKPPLFHACIQTSIPRHKIKTLNNHRENHLHFYINNISEPFFSIIFLSNMFNRTMTFTGGFRVRFEWPQILSYQPFKNYSGGKCSSIQKLQIQGNVCTEILYHQPSLVWVWWNSTLSDFRETTASSLHPSKTKKGKHVMDEESRQSQAKTTN